MNLKSAILPLSDCHCWILEPTDLQAERIVNQLRLIMHLPAFSSTTNGSRQESAPWWRDRNDIQPSEDSSAQTSCWRFRRLVVATGSSSTISKEEPKRMLMSVRPLAGAEGHKHTVLASLDYDVMLPVPRQNELSLVAGMNLLSNVIAYQTELNGGVLLHGALAAYESNGIILAGPSGVGKTTSSRQLPTPWRSLSDDATLVVCGEDGRFWAHPWPTWGRFYFEPSEESWDVSRAVELKGIFFLRPFRTLGTEHLTQHQAIGLLLDSAHQVSFSWQHYLRQEELRLVRTKRLENLCELTRSVPSFDLYLQWNDLFWTAIEKALYLTDLIDRKIDYDYPHIANRWGTNKG